MMCDGSTVATVVATQQEVQHQRSSGGSIATATAMQHALVSEVAGFAPCVASSK